MIELTFDDLTGSTLHFNATEEFIKAIENVMLAKLKMMRGIDEHNKEYWFCSACKIGDLSNSNSLSFQYGRAEDEHWLKNYGQVFVKIYLSNELYKGYVTEAVPDNSWLHPYIGYDVQWNEKIIILDGYDYDNENYEARKYLKRYE